MKKIVLLVVIGITMIGASIIALNSGDKQSAENKAAQPNNINQTPDIARAATPADSNKYNTITKDDARVTVDVTPKQLGLEEENNIFSISLNTHSVELEFDFTEIMVLKDNLGNSYSALEWTGNSGWHHVSGDIIFPRIDESATSVELQINNINGVERVFNWSLK